MAEANRDNNFVTTLIGTSLIDNDTPVNIWADPVTHELLTKTTLAAGSVVIGDIANITTSITPGFAASNLGKRDDDPMSTNDVGVMALAVANEGLAQLTTTDMDYTPMGVDRRGVGFVQQSFLPVSFTTTSAQAVGTTDAAYYKSVSVHVVTQGTTSTVTFQGSNDNTNWVNVGLNNVNITTANIVTSTTTAGTMYAGSLPFRYFRLNVTGIAGGTTAGVIVFSAFPYSNAIGTLSVNASQTGTWTVQPGNTPNTTAWLVKETRATTGTTTSVAGSASNVTLLASNAARLHFSIFNDSSAVLYIKYGATASTTSYLTQIPAFTLYEDAFDYTGIVDGIWASATGSARITEL